MKNIYILPDIGKVSNASVLDYCAFSVAFAEIHGCSTSLHLINYAPGTDNN